MKFLPQGGVNPYLYHASAKIKYDRKDNER